MICRCRRILAVLGPALLLLFLSCGRLPTDEIARVNGERISLAEFRHSYELFPVFQRTVSPEEALRQQLDHLIDQVLAEQEARRRGLDRREVFTVQRQMLLKEEARDELYREMIQKPIRIEEEELLEAYRLSQYRLKLKMLWSDSEAEIREMRRRLLAGESVEQAADRFYGRGKWQKEDIQLPEVSWGDLDEELEQKIFALPRGGVTEPVQRNGTWVILQLVDFKQNIFVTETDYLRRKPALRRVLLRRKSAVAARKFVANYMSAQRIRVRAPAFNFLWKYARKQAGLELSRSDSLQLEPIRYDLAGELERHLDDTLLVAADRVWTVEEFLQRMKTTPKALRPNMLHPMRFKQELQQFILNEFLSDLAFERGMQKRKRVRQALTEWEHSFLSDFLQQVMIRELQPTAQQIEAAFAAAPERYRIPEKRKIREIYTREKEKADQAWRALQNGRDFEAVRRQYSERNVGLPDAPGTFDYLSLSQLGQIGPQVFQLKKGEISPPIKVFDGWVIVQLLGIQPARQAKLEEVREQVRKEWIQQQHLQRWRQLRRDLRAAARIRINEKLLKREAENFDPKKYIPLFGLRKAYPGRRR